MLFNQKEKQQSLDTSCMDEKDNLCKIFIARKTKLKLVKVIIRAVLRKNKQTNKHSDSTGKTVLIEKHHWGPMWQMA